jgi:CheY-like chemotaxis protein
MTNQTSLSGIRVLVIEDEPIICMFIEDALSDLGCKTGAIATNLTDAKIKVAEGDFDVVMLDVNLKGELSFAMAETLTAQQLPFIFSTGYGKVGIPIHLQHVPVLQKPFQENELREKLQLALTATHF